MGSLQILHRSRVEESEIDELGHLSVPFYEQRSLEASQALLAEHGLDSHALADRGIEPILVDTFTRNYKEQFLGAPLMVQGGVLDVEDGQIRLYHELINPESDELSATFVHALMLQAIDSRRPVALDQSVIDRLTRTRIDWPEHGRPRSLDLSRPLFSPDLAEARRRDLASRQARTVQADECDPAGFLEPQQFQHLPYSGTPVDDPSTQWVIETEDGIRLGLADLESRSMRFSLPRAGERIQVFSADVEIARKTFRRSHWVFSLDSGDLLTASTVVVALLDLDQRRAIEISAELRTRFERRYHPDLR
jgi:acyl-CoA thioesterase FadM